MLVHLAGPIVNLAVAWGICFPLLVLRGDGSRVLGLLDPLSPNLIDPAATPWQSLVPLAFWINWCLVIVNLIPAYPFDGGQVLRRGRDLAQVLRVFDSRRFQVVD